jgi:hypothetical protein
MRGRQAQTAPFGAEIQITVARTTGRTTKKE